MNEESVYPKGRGRGGKGGRGRGGKGGRGRGGQGRGRAGKGGGRGREGRGGTNSSLFTPDRRKFRIFQIGFNKCGTRTLYQFFRKNKVPSVHYDGGRIAGSMFRHHIEGRPLIDKMYRKKVFFSDMENIRKEAKPLYVAQSLFRKLDHQCPHSKFILNTRDRENWIRSRAAHEGGEYLRSISNKLDYSVSDTLDLWRLEWDQHHRDVLDYFRDRPTDLLIFDIEKDGPKKLAHFFRPYFRLDPSLYEHLGKTK